MSEQSERAARRQAQRQATLERNEAQARRQQKSAVRRRGALIAGASVVVAAVVLVVVFLVTRTSPPTKPRAPVLTKQTLAKVANASATAQGDGGAWVTDDDRDLLLRFDPSTQRTGRSVHLGGRPVDLLLSGTHLWVAEMVTNDVQEFDAATLKLVRTVAVPSGPAGLAVLDGDLWVASVDANQVTSITLANGIKGSPLSIPGGAVRIAAGFGSLWVTGTTNTLTPITPGDHGTGTVLPAITVGQAPIGVTTGDGSVWVANSAGGTVSRVNPKTRTVTNTDHVGGNPLSLAVVGDTVYLADGSGQSVRTIYPAPASKKLDLDATPRLLLPVDGGVWVASANPGRVLEVKPG